MPVPSGASLAMAAGFTRGMTAVVTTLIRSLFWHRDRGAFRVDGRTKRVDRGRVRGLARSVTEGRARLIGLGWLVPRETSQFLLNRYGALIRSTPSGQPRMLMAEQWRAMSSKADLPAHRAYFRVNLPAH